MSLLHSFPGQFKSIKPLAKRASQLRETRARATLHYHFMPSADWQAVMLAGVGRAWISAAQLASRDLSSEWQFSGRAGVGVLKGHADGV